MGAGVTGRPPGSGAGATGGPWGAPAGEAPRPAGPPTDPVSVRDRYDTRARDRSTTTTAGDGGRHRAGRSPHRGVGGAGPGDGPGSGGVPGPTRPGAEAPVGHRGGQRMAGPGGPAGDQGPAERAGHHGGSGRLRRRHFRGRGRRLTRRRGDGRSLDSAPRPPATSHSSGCAWPPPTGNDDHRIWENRRLWWEDEAFTAGGAAPDRLLRPGEPEGLRRGGGLRSGGGG